jgi:DNA-directed RNA polymerase subunit H
LEKLKEEIERKIDLLCKLRKYNIKSSEKKENLKDYIATDHEDEKAILIRAIYKTRLSSGVIGVNILRKTAKNIIDKEYKRGILIGKGFSVSAKKEARSRNIEAVSLKQIPTFNIFNHDLVPKHEILPEKEAKQILEKYHVHPNQLPRIRTLDPAVFLIGAKKGDIIKITRESPTAGIHVTYRYVV